MLIANDDFQKQQESQTSLVIFLLNQVHYAIVIEPIQQIIEMVTITPVLKTEAWMEGVINYHGFSVPVINLRRHFGMAVVPYRWHTPIILVNIAHHQVGLIVDDVLDVLTLPSVQIMDPKNILPVGTPETPLLTGIIQADAYITLLLDLTHLFDQVQVRALTTVASALSAPSPQPADPLKAAKKKRGENSPKTLPSPPLTPSTSDPAAESESA